MKAFGRIVSSQRGLVLLQIYPLLILLYFVFAIFVKVNPWAVLNYYRLSLSPKLVQVLCVLLKSLRVKLVSTF